MRRRSTSIRYLSILIHNSIPLVGAVFFAWSAAMLLVLFWWDNLLQVIFNSILILLHRRLTDDPDHRTGRRNYSGRRFAWIDDTASKGTFLSQYARHGFVFLAFCAAALLIVFSFFVNLELNFNWRELSIGLALAAAIGLSELLMERPSIGRRSFLWLQWRVWSSTEIGLLVIILLFGIPMAVWFGTTMPALVVLVLIKILADGGAAMVEEEKARLWPAGWDERATPPI